MMTDGSDGSYRGCAYTVLQTVQIPGAFNAVYGAVHYAEPLSSDKSGTWSRAFFCRDISMLVQKRT